MTEDERFVAYHEAGHVVRLLALSEDLGETFAYVTINPDEDRGSLGHVRLEPIGRTDPSCFDFDLPDDVNKEGAGFTQRSLEARLSCNLAGEAATFVKFGIRDEVGAGRGDWRGDYKDCMDYLESIFRVGDDVKSAGNEAADHYLEALFWRTVLFLEQPPWLENVEAIVDALIERRTLNLQECRDIFYSDKLTRGNGSNSHQDGSDRAVN